MRRFVLMPRQPVACAVIIYVSAIGYHLTAQSRLTLSAPFVRQVLATPGAAGESRFDLRFFTTAIKTDSRGDIITGTTSDPVKAIVGAEYASERAGLSRFTKILFGADYFNGRPDPSTRSSQLVETNNQPQKGESR